MIDWLTSLLSAALGVPSFVLGATLLTWALWRMACHSVLLFARVECPDMAKDPDSRMFDYSIYVQNLEEVAFPGPLQLVLSEGSCTKTSAPLTVTVLAGPKNVCVLPAPGSSDWRATFEELPPFDTWLLRIRSESPNIELRIDTGPRGTWLKRNLLIDLEPRSIRICAHRAQQSLFRGATKTPPLSLLWAITFAAAFSYAAAIGWLSRDGIHLNIGSFQPGWADLFMVGGLMITLWLGYRRIQRPVYPIIQGYFFETVATAAAPAKSGNER